MVRTLLFMTPRSSHMTFFLRYVVTWITTCWLKINVESDHNLVLSVGLFFLFPESSVYIHTYTVCIAYVYSCFSNSLL